MQDEKPSGEPHVEDASDSPPYDPLLAQAQSLPSFKKGEGDPNEHVRSADENEDAVDEEVLDDGMGYEPPDPSTFTAD